MLNYGWVCPKCGRVYAPNQEMCLFCGQEEKKQSLTNLGDWISTNPCLVDTQKGPTNIPETNSAPGSPLYTTTTGIIGYEGPSPSVTLNSENSIMQCSAYVNGRCLGTKEPFESDCQGILSKCTEYNNEKR